MLARMLDEAGIKYGKINVTDEEFNAYRDLSPKQIAEKYAKDHLLKDIGKVFNFITYVYELNQKGEYTGQFREKMEEMGLDIKYYLFIFRYASDGLIKVVGQRAQTTWTWLPKRAPQFEDAQFYYSKVNVIRSYKLSYIHRNIINEDPTLDHETVVSKFKLTSPDDILAAKFKVHGILSNIKSRMKNKNKNKQEEHNTITSVEYRSVPKPIELNVPVQTVKVDEIVKEDKEKGKGTSEQYTAMKGQLFLACQKVEMYKGIIQNQEEHIASIEAEMLSWYTKYHKLKKKYKKIES